MDYESETLIAFSSKDNGADAMTGIAPTLRAMGHAMSHANAGGQIAVAHTLKGGGFDASEDGTGRGVPIVPIAFDTTQITSSANRCNPQPGDPCHPITAHGHAPAIAIQAGALRQNPASGPDGIGVQEGVAYTIEARAEVQAVQQGWRVRRLSVLECERLMAFPDGYTAVPYRGKIAADGPRYKALGNSMSVNVMSWVGQRIDIVDRILKRRQAA